MWQKLKLEKLNISTKQILKPNVTTMVETHVELDITIIEVDNLMASKWHFVPGLPSGSP
jgi:hypothetical protein